MKRITLNLFSFLLLFLVNLGKIYSFQDLKSVELFAQENIEYPKPDNINPLKPDYSSFYKTQKKTELQNLLYKLGNILGFKKITWDASNLTSSLIRVTNHRKNIFSNKDYILKITPQKNTDFTIWTDLQGAFHSLARDLKELFDTGYIDANLQIIKAETFFIFNGNVLGFSPYIMETLNLILNLMEKNPNNVFFIKGEVEIKDNWQNFGLKTELLAKMEKTLSDKIPLQAEITNFLETLPLAIYIKNNLSKEPELIRISYFDRDNTPNLNENLITNFLNKKSKKEIEAFELNEKETTQQPTINIKAIIKGEKRTTTFKTTEGLRSTLPDRGATSWITLSSPTKRNQDLYNFCNDAFIILNIKKNQNSEIKLIKQNALKKDGFTTTAFNLTSQVFEKPKIQKEKVLEEIKITDKAKTVEPLKQIIDKQKEIKVGTTLDLSAELSEISRYILKGLYLKILQINENGGINGKNIKFVYLDDKYDAQLARKNVQDLINMGIKTLLCPVGSLTLKSYVSLVQKKQIAVIFPEATSPVYRKKELTNIIHFLGASDKEGEVLAQYLMKEIIPSKVVLFYQKETFSESALEGAIKILKKYNLIEGRDYIKVEHLPNSIDMEDAAKEIKKFNPEAILLLSPSIAVQNLVNKLETHYLFNKSILGISTCSGSAFKTFLRDKNLKFINTQLIPDPEKSDLEIVKEFRQAAEKAGEPLSEFTLEGYVAASIFANILEKIQGIVTNDKIIEEAEKIKNYNFKGLLLNFDPETRQLANTIWLDTGEKVLMFN